MLHSGRMFRTIIVTCLITCLILSLAAQQVVQVFSLFPQVYPREFGWALLVWGFSTALALYFLAVVTQLKPLGQDRARLYVPSLVGLTLVTMVLVYIVVLFVGSVLGFHNNTPLWAMFSYWAKHLLGAALLLMFGAFVFSYQPARWRALRFVAIGCALVAGCLFVAALNNVGNGHVYFSWIALFTVGGLGATWGIVRAAARGE